MQCTIPISKYGQFASFLYGHLSAVVLDENVCVCACAI